MNKIIQQFEQVLLDLRRHHWNTTGLAEHQALGAAYDAIDGYIDTIAETLVGHEGPITPTKNTTPECKASEMPKCIDMAAKQLREYSVDKYPDLVNLSDEITAVASKLRFFYRLS